MTLKVNKETSITFDCTFDFKNLTDKAAVMEQVKRSEYIRSLIIKDLKEKELMK